MSFGVPGDYPTPGSGAEATVSTGYDASATSIVLTTGHGARFPAVPFYLTWYNFTDFPYSAQSGMSLQATLDPNQEIVLVTNRTDDTLTVTRGQQGTSASTKNTALKTYKMRIVGPMWSKFHQNQPEYRDVLDKHIYEDGGSSFVTFNDTAPIRWAIIYEPHLSLLQAAVLDGHRAEAFGEVYGFTLTNPRTGVAYTDVHYDEEFQEDHKKTWSNSREIHLIKRPA